MPNNIGTTVDQLGELQAQIVELQTRERELKDAIKEMGDGAYEGDLFRATISTADRATLDTKAARKKLQELGVTPQWFAAHTRHTDVTTCKVVARTGEGV